MIENLLSAWWVWAVPVAFLAVLFYAFNPKRKKQFEEEARVPLEDDPPVKCGHACHSWASVRGFALRRIRPVRQRAPLDFRLHAHQDPVTANVV